MEHMIHWFEIPAKDFERACTFYEQMLAVKLFIENYGGSGMQMAVFPGNENTIRGAIVAGNQAVTTCENGVVVYLNAGGSLQATLNRAVQLDASILVPHIRLPDGNGFIAHIRDCEGNRIGLHSDQP